ncbi:MAG: phosphoenolpyruvate--protein phosphotransferase, partial [Simkaniaceae bacterium]|nr:phosphoenolpyruvate--protein phosphotransferase [Simkaniaceae bacterium]
EAVIIIDTHIQMLEDPFITTLVEEKIRALRKNTEKVFSSVMRDYESRFEAIADEFFKERILDVKDLSNRILRHLNVSDKQESPSIPQGAIVFAKQFVPSDTAEASHARVQAFVSELGGETSHAVLIAKAKGLPFVTNIDLSKLSPASQVIVDGKAGLVIIDPTKSTLEKYQNLIDSLRYKTPVALFSQEEVMTKDGVQIQVFANIDTLEDLESSLQYGAHGIGLFRTEFLSFHHALVHFSYEAQREIYERVFKAYPTRPVTFRLFDVGGDKGMNGVAQEVNPALGYRAMRFLLKEKGILKTQLRALMDAAGGKKLQILLPLVTDLKELREIKEFITLVKGNRVIDLSLGVMIETPAAVMMADQLATACDAFSIGTNDLTQLTLAVDRGNPRVNHLYHAFHPSVLRMIKQVCSFKVPVALCGEMASNPLYTSLLIGLGVRQLSCIPRFIQEVQKGVMKTSRSAAEKLAEKALQESDAEGVHRLLINDYC